MQIVALEVLERMCTHLTCAPIVKKERSYVNNSISHVGYQPAIGSRLGEVKVVQRVPWNHANSKGEDFASVLNMRRDHGTQGACTQMAMEMVKRRK